MQVWVPLLAVKLNSSRLNNASNVLNQKNLIFFYIPKRNRTLSKNKFCYITTIFQRFYFRSVCY